MARPLTLGMLKKTGTEPWLYEALKALITATKDSQAGLAAINRGEAPNGSGQPLTPDLTGFFKLAGRHPGQVGYGGTNNGDNLTFSSTFAGVKGKIFLGFPVANLTVDEVQSLVGINQMVPASTLHIVGSISGSGATLIPSTDISPTGTQWIARGGGTWSGIGGTLAAAMSADDGVTTMGTINVTDSGLNPEICGLSGTVIPGATYTVTARIATLTSIPVAGQGSFWALSLTDSAGNRWSSTNNGSEVFNESNSPIVEITSPSPSFFTIVRTVRCAGTPVVSGDPNINSIRLSAQAYANAGGGHALYLGCTSIAVTQTGASLARWDFSSGSQSGGIDILGHLGIATGSGSLSAAMINTIIDAGGTIGLLIKGVIAQTANFLQLTTSAGTIVSGFDSAGSHFGDNHSVAYEDSPVYYNDDMVWY